MKTTHLLGVGAVYTEFMTCSNAVSVECPRRYANCSRAKFGEDGRCGRCLSRTNRSITFEMVVRSDIGRYLDISSLSSPGFFSKDSICAVFNASGKWHSANDRLAMCAMISTKAAAHERNRNDDNNKSLDLQHELLPTLLSDKSDERLNHSS